MACTPKTSTQENEPHQVYVADDSILWPVLYEMKTENGTFRQFYQKNYDGYYTLWTKMSNEHDSLAIRLETPYFRYEGSGDFYDEGTPDAFYYTTSTDQKYLYVVACVHANSNGWTDNYQLYKINCRNLDVTLIADCAAIKVTERGFTTVLCRCVNEDSALCTSDQIWVMHDVHLDWEGNVVSIDEREYDYNEMEERFLTPGTEYWYIRGFNQRMSVLKSELQERQSATFSLLKSQDIVVIDV